MSPSKATLGGRNPLSKRRPLAEPTRREKVGWIQAGLVLLFFALLLVLYLAPEGTDSGGRPEWWTWVVVAMPAAAALFLQFWRRGPRV